MRRQRMIRWTWASPMDARALAAYLGLAVGLVAAGFVPPIAVAVTTGALTLALRLTLVAAFCSAIGLFAWRHRPARLDQREALMITGLAYPVWSLAAAVAWWPGKPFTLALFETTSGITTTGLSVFQSASLSYAELFFRAWLQWVGGAGIAILSVGVIGGIASIALFTTEHSRSEIVGNVLRTTRIVLVAYLVLSAVVAVGLLVAGLSPGRAILYTLATLSTGGFQPAGTGDVAGLPSVVLMAGMLLGATPFVLHREPRRLQRDSRLRTLLALVAIAWMVVWSLDGGSVLDAGFAVVTAITTTGFTLDDPAAWTPARQTVALVLMILGGCAGSTAGGLKVFRVGVLAAMARLWVFREVVPREAKVALRYNGRPVTEEMARGVTVFVAVYLATLAAGAFGLAASGLPLGSALFGSASALGTVGLWTGPPLETLPESARGLMIFLMWAGRVELLPLLLILYPPSWRGRRSAHHKEAQ